MTPQEIRARVDEITSRTNPDGSINAQHVTLEQTLRERHGHPSYIAELDGPGKFRPPGEDDDDPGEDDDDPDEDYEIHEMRRGRPVVHAHWVEGCPDCVHRAARLEAERQPGPFDSVHAAAVERVGRKLQRLEVQAAAVNALAVASVAYRENRLALSRTIRWSIGYGVPMPEVISTTGLPEALVLELLDEVD